MSGQHAAGRDEFRHHTPEAKRGMLMIRGLDDDTLLDAAREPAGSALVVLMDEMGRSTNPRWVTTACAQAAYARGLIDGQELDWITR